jgi:ketosteroid isomerase-like protein
MNSAQNIGKPPQVDGDHFNGVVGGPAAGISEYRTIIAHMFRTVDRRDWQSLAHYFSHDVVYERPGYPPLRGIDELLAFYRAARVIESGEHELHKIIAEREQVVCCGRFVGRHRNGSLLDERFADAYTFCDGKIRTRCTYFFRPAV